MTSTVTVDEIAVKLLDNQVLQSLELVDVEVTSVDTATDIMTVDALLERYLPPSVNESFPKVDFSKESFGAGFEFKGFRFYVRLQGLSLLIVILTLATLILGTEAIGALLRTMVGL